MKKIYLISTLILLGNCCLVFGQITFNYTGGMQSYTVPPGSSAMCYTVRGAQGMTNLSGNAGGGLGGQITGIMPVVPGQVIQIFVGGGGIMSTTGGFNGGANGGTSACVNASAGGGGGASDIRVAPFGLANRMVVAGGGGGTGGNRVQGCGPGCGGGGGGGYYGGGGGGAYGGSPGTGGSQIAGGNGGASCCGCPVAPQPGAPGIFGIGGAGGGVGTNNQAANNPGCAGGVGGALIGGTGPNCTGGTGCPSTWAGASGGGGSNFAAGGGTITTNSAGVQAGNGLVIINPNCCTTPTITAISNPTAICAGASATLTASGAGVGGTYTWQPGNITGSVIAVTPAATTIYTVSGTTSFSCTGTNTIMLTVNPLPVVNPASNSPICTGNTLSLTVGASTSYTWTGPNAYSSNLQNPTITNASTLNTGTYTVTVANAFGCVTSATTNVTVTPPTVLTPSNTGPYCAGATIQFNSPAATSYTWTGPPAFNSNLQNPTIVASTTLMSGIYTLTATFGTCKSVGTTSVTVYALPTPTASNTGPYCAGTTIQLNVNSATSYTWSGPNAYSSNNQNPTVATSSVVNGGVYTVSVTNTNGCVNSATTNVVVNPIPIPLIGSNSPVCVGTSINFNSGGGTSYAWSGPSSFTSTLQNPTIANSTTLNIGVYTLTVTALNCSNTATISVSVLTPTASAGNTGPYCAGATIQLNSAAATSYTWTGPNAFTSSAQNPTIAASTVAMSGVYNLIASVGTCTAGASTSVTVMSLPTPTISNNGPICNGQSLNLSASGAVTYTWSGPGAYTSQNQNPTIAVASPSNSGVYTVTVTDLNSCKNYTTTNVTVNPTPTLTAVGSSVCVGQNISIFANSLPGATFVWAGPLSFLAVGQNTTIANAQVNMSGVYNVTVTSAVGCTNTSFANVNVTALPVPIVSNSSPVCAGSILNLTASGGSSYVWMGPNAFNSVSSNPTINNVSLNANGVYSVVVTANNCSIAATTTVLINPLPTPVATNNGPVCEAKVLNLTGSGGISYLWTGPAGFNSQLQNPSISNVYNNSSGIYNLTVVDANGCQATATTAVIINQNPSILANGALVCIGSSAVLTATGGVSYLWIGPSGFTSNQQNATIPIVLPSNSGNYTVIATAANSCTSSSIVDLDTYPLPVPTITATAKTCVNTPVNLTGSPGFLLYQWKGPDNFVSPNISTSFVPSSMSQSGTYTLSVLDSRGCSGSITAFVALDPLPNANILVGNNKKCIPFCTTFSLQNASASTSLVTSGWFFNGQSFNGSNLNYCVSGAGNYMVKANFTDANGCSNSVIDSLTAYPIPTAMFEFSPATPIEAADEVHFVDGSQGPGINQWFWHFVSNNGFQSAAQNPSYTFEKAGTYPIALVVTNKWGCSDTTMRTITVGEDNSFYVPNAFTPNEDGINDIFLAKGYNISKFEMMIFDRWGTKLFNSNDITLGWDGSFKGQECKEDVYVWKINVTIAGSKVKAYTGHLTLNR